MDGTGHDPEFTSDIQADDEVDRLLREDAPAERRDGERLAIRRRCTVHEPRSRRTVRGRTTDISRSGALLRLDGRVPVAAGDRVFLGVCDGGRLRREPELLAAEVVRVVSIGSGETILAVRTGQIAATMRDLLEAA